MNFLDLLKVRYTSKSFKKDMVPKEKVENIFKSLSLVPSYKDKQSFKALLITDNNIKSLIEKSISDDNSSKKGFLEAPLSIVVVSNTNVSKEYNKDQYYMLDGAIAMYTIMLAAASEGLGSAWIEIENEDNLKNSLDIPKKYKVIGVTPIGYSNDIDIENKYLEDKHIFDNIYENVWKNNSEYTI